tara:strand:+ start:1406 stop:1738 length:333 start_codon:yes stop_codon:yes gene_type:complete
MASKLKVDGDKVKDGGRQVARIYNNKLYKGTSTSSSNILARTYNDKIYSKDSTSSSYCIGRVYSGNIYNKDTTSSSAKVGSLRDAEKVISGRCSDEVLAAIFLNMKNGSL